MNSCGCHLTEAIRRGEDIEHFRQQHRLSLPPNNHSSFSFYGRLKAFHQDSNLVFSFSDSICKEIVISTLKTFSHQVLLWLVLVLDFSAYISLYSQSSLAILFLSGLCWNNFTYLNLSILSRTFSWDMAGCQKLLNHITQCVWAWVKLFWDIKPICKAKCLCQYVEILVCAIMKDIPPIIV